ncbi:MAG: ADP-ribosylation factor-like protein, partial [Candidatus Hodarchaeales archaeon]
MGLAESGKSTIIRSVVEGETPKLGERYDATIHYQRKRKVIADTELVVFDLGGQIRFLDRFTGDLAEFVFSETDIFIFVIEPLKVADFSRAKYYFELSLEKLQQFSPNAQVYIFLHKIDLLPTKMVETASKNIRNYLTSDLAREYQFYETSVFSESIFIALGKILADMTGIRERVSPILEEFLQENASILDFVQVLTEKGAILATAKTRAAIEKITIKQTKELFDSAIRRLIIGKEVREQEKIVLIESEDFLSYTNFLDNGLALLLIFSKKGLRKSPKLTATLHDKIILLSKQVNEFRKPVGTTPA